MSDEMDDFVGKLQQEILDEVKASYGMTLYERWQNPVYMGALADPDGYARVTGPCGDTVEIFLKFEKDRVKEATFQTDGCGTTQVCGSFAAEMALGKSPDQLLEVTGEAILERVGGLPEENTHCAHLAADTLSMALEDYMIRQNRRGKQE
jgi:nitrogen fixation NifU-like protein